MSLWWFDADHKRARDVFIKRGYVPVEAFENQINSIRTNWKSIKGVFGTHIIRTLEADGTRLAPETILAKIEETLL